MNFPLKRYIPICFFIICDTFFLSSFFSGSFKVRYVVPFFFFFTKVILEIFSSLFELPCGQHRLMRRWSRTIGFLEGAAPEVRLPQLPCEGFLCHLFLFPSETTSCLAGVPSWEWISLLASNVWQWHSPCTSPHQDLWTEFIGGTLSMKYRFLVYNSTCTIWTRHCALTIQCEVSFHHRLCLLTLFHLPPSLWYSPCRCLCLWVGFLLLFNPFPCFTQAPQTPSLWQLSFCSLSMSLFLFCLFVSLLRNHI